MPELLAPITAMWRGATARGVLPRPPAPPARAAGRPGLLRLDRGWRGACMVGGADMHPITTDEPQREGPGDTAPDRESGVRVRAQTPWPPGDASIEGMLLGPYELLEPLGSGAMGHVYRARHLLLGRAVAIKVLRAELARDRASVERFVAEARAVNLLNHPHVLDVTDIAMPCEEGQVPWFVMELLEGADLASLITRGDLDVLRALRIARQVCDALAAIHSVGIVHRDVKPENVFVTQRDRRDFVKLIDFGIARLHDPDGAEPTCEWLVGTPDYMAPEQVGERPIDHRADLYGLGSLLFDLLTGAPPFHGEELSNVLADLLLTKAPRVSSRRSLPASVRDDLDALVARCLEKEAARRPSSAHEIIDALDSIIARLEDRAESFPASFLTEPDSAPLVLEPSWRTRLRRAPRFAFGLGALAVGVVAFVARPARAPEAALPAAEVADAPLAIATEPAGSAGAIESIAPAPVPARVPQLADVVSVTSVPAASVEPASEAPAAAPAQSARRSPRRAARERAIEPVFVITPSDRADRPLATDVGVHVYADALAPEPAQPAAPAPLTAIDRDGVLNPFAE